MSRKRNLTPEEQEHRVESNYKNLMETLIDLIELY